MMDRRTRRNNRRRGIMVIGGTLILTLLLTAAVFRISFAEGRLTRELLLEERPEAETEGTDPDRLGKEGEIDPGHWALKLVSGSYPLDYGYAPEVRQVDGTEYTFDVRAAAALEQMLSDCRAAGLDPIICSGYRSVEYQSTLYDNQIQKQIENGYSPEEAPVVAAGVVAVPGTSEHNLGLAADIVALGYQLLEEDQEDTAACRWLHENCQAYGFILRYPKDKQDITGIIYEPWHFRYVGVEAATEIMERGITLEEYLGVG